MLSRILAAGLCALAVAHAATALQAPMAPDIDVPHIQAAAVKSGFYEIHNKAYDGQLVAFYRDELIVVLNNATEPKVADLGKWKVKEVAPAMYSITNVGLGVGLFPRDDFIVAGKSEVLFSIASAGNKLFTISDPEVESEDHRVWTLYSFCEAEVHLDPVSGDQEQLWEFRPWAQ
ncbi:hypothetical protein DFH09DRAFT_1155548 [Mycena vulgaris]|nr:hypothetical protein DFH09DRAFT_1155548 [Mycena vulgaris]